MSAVDALPAHLQAALADPDAVGPLMRMATAAYAEAVDEGNSPRVLQGLAALAAQAAVAVLRLGLLEGRVHVALGSGPGLVAEARPYPGLDAITWIDAWYLSVLADRPDLREDLQRLRHLLPGEAWALAWVEVLSALEGRHPDVGGALGAAERLLPRDGPESALLPVAAALLVGGEVEPPSPRAGWGARAFAALAALRQT